MQNLAAIVMAAGIGKRMKSSLPKVLHEVCRQPMLFYVLDACRAAGLERIVVVAGPDGEVATAIGDRAEVVTQHERKGTAHAVMQAEAALSGFEGTVLVLAGDMPLITAETLKEVINDHIDNKRAATVITNILDNPFGYGRIIRNGDELIGIVEEKDADDSQKQIREVNTSVYCFDAKELFAALPEIDNNNAQGEYYLTDVLKIMKARSLSVGAFIAKDPGEFLGVNDRAQLAEVDAVMRRRINVRHAQNGVSIIDLDRTYISPTVEIEPDVTIFPGTILEGNTNIGQGAVIGSNCRIHNSKVGAGAKLEYAVLTDAEVGENTTVGPFAYLRPGTVVGSCAKVGDFVEIKNSTIGEGTKVPHLAYIGDSDVGSGVNIGCGTITVNYDGAKKHRTIIEDNVFVGCNSNLVSPVRIGEGAYIAAGSTITEDVPGKTLAIARARQTIKYNWTDKRSAKQ